MGGRVSEGFPPRPGTPEYDAWRKKQEAEADRDKENDPSAPKTDSPGIAGLPKKGGPEFSGRQTNERAPEPSLSALWA